MKEPNNNVETMARTSSERRAILFITTSFAHYEESDIVRGLGELYGAHLSGVKPSDRAGSVMRAA